MRSRPRILTAVAILAVFGPSSFADDPDALFRAMRDAHQAAFDAFVKAGEVAKTPEDQEKVLNHPGRRPRDFAPGFMDLARKNPGTPAAEDCLLWITTHIFQTAETEEAKRILVRDFIRSPRLGPALGFQGHYSDPFEGSETFFRRILADSPHRDIQGLATYWLARHVLAKASLIRAVEKNPNLYVYEGKDYFADTYGKDWRDRLHKLDPEALLAESDSLFERVAKYYADVPHNDKRRTAGGSLGEAAQSYLREHRDLAIGKSAPAFEASDLDGKPFRLKDGLGKVMVVDFGSHFYCGACRTMYPALREMATRLQGKDFLLVSVNAEPDKSLKELKAAWVEEGNTWPCLFDGNWEGPIQKSWNIQTFPTIYVLDGKGTIRHKYIGGVAANELNRAVDALLAEAAKP